MIHSSELSIWFIIMIRHYLPYMSEFKSIHPQCHNEQPAFTTTKKVGGGGNCSNFTITEQISCKPQKFHKKFHLSQKEVQEEYLPRIQNGQDSCSANANQKMISKLYAKLFLKQNYMLTYIRIGKALVLKYPIHTKEK